MNTFKKCYYKSLQVPKDASLNDIKASFRKLSKETHPDVATQGCPKRNADRFKEISEAYKILSNAKDRRRYDLELQDRYWYQNRSRPGGGFGGFGGGGSTAYGHMRPPPQGPKATGVYAVLDTVFKPSNLFMGIAVGTCTILLYQSLFGDDKKKRLAQQYHGSQLVEAWKNPNTGQWEQAAPWDPTYRRLKPTLELVPREQVQSRTR